MGLSGSGTPPMHMSPGKKSEKNVVHSNGNFFRVVARIWVEKSVITSPDKSIVQMYMVTHYRGCDSTIT